MQLMDQTIIFTPHSGDVLFYGGLAFGIAGLYLMMLARSPGTNPEVPAKPYSSEVRLPPSP
jgi:predicted cobalt transporter CbtA